MHKNPLSLSAVLLSAAMLALGGCAGAEPLTAGEHQPVTMSAWSAYWDAEAAARELKKQRHLAGVSCFAAAFEADGSLYLPEEMPGLKKQAAKGGRATYLTIVNDVRPDKGPMKEKDTEIVKQVLADEAAADRHIGDILAQAEQLGAEGVEIDYEKLWKDKELTGKFLDFTYRLSSACTRKGLKLRIVLEPSAPLDAPWAKGPEYTVMCYNLYGKHSGPGPKADRNFLLKTFKKMEALPGNKSVAFATGGCLWENPGLLDGPKGKTSFKTEAELTALAREHKAETVRDAESAALSFEYEAEGKHYVAWYADAETLNAWITLAARQGLDKVMLWRLGGNTDLDEVKP